MSIKEFFRPNIPKILIFLFIAIFFLSAKESVCGAGFLFSFCYKSYGFPFDYLVIGDPSSVGYVKTLAFGQFFFNAGSLMLNPVTLTIDIILIYALASLFFLIFSVKSKRSLSG